MPDEQTYAAAGVSLATADAVVERLRAAVESTRTPGVRGAFGAFAGLFALDDERLLAASTDSVGTKLVLARRAGTLRWCGADLAAHGINDVATTGAEPLFFLDYVAAGRIDPEQVTQLAHLVEIEAMRRQEQVGVDLLLAQELSHECEAVCMQAARTDADHHVAALAA